MIRRLLVILLGAAALVLWARLTRAGRRPASHGNAEIRNEGPMVRDRVCDTFLPRGRALKARRGGEDHYFCSSACRQAFLLGRPQGNG